MRADLFSAQSKTIKINLTTTASASIPLPEDGNVVRIVVVGSGAGVVSLAIGSGAQTAVLASGTASASALTLLPGTDSTFSIPADSVLNISGITDAGTASIYVQVGEGQ